MMTMCVCSTSARVERPRARTSARWASTVSSSRVVVDDDDDDDDARRRVRERMSE
jgi:hypothetical protein